ncbi:MAG: hypothetical protein QOG03_2197 [Actinomycetota bacterium]|jgi:hypothetical protein|nr:hypothetical protein [Actinomycetota bacterium]
MSAPSAGEVTAETSALPGERAVRRVLGASVVVMIAFWTAWYGHRSLVASGTSQSYYDFENAFPLADLWLTTCLFAGLWTLPRRHPTALLWILLGAGGGIYLFAMDVLYDIEHGVWWKSGGGVVELVINVVTLTVSLFLLRWAWRNRVALLDHGDR